MKKDLRNSILMESRGSVDDVDFAVVDAQQMRTHYCIDFKGMSEERQLTWKNFADDFIFEPRTPFI